MNFSKLATFKTSKHAPFSSWYPYLEGYSTDFVLHVLDNYIPSAKKILDPFYGSGSTGVAASTVGVSTFYCEVNPALRFISDVKFSAISLTGKEKERVLSDLKISFNSINTIIDRYDKHQQLEDAYSLAFVGSDFFNQNNFEKILRARSYLETIDSRIARDLLTVAFLNALLPSSNLKRAGDVRYKTEKELKCGIPDYYAVVKDNLAQIINDISNNNIRVLTKPKLACENAFDLRTLEKLDIDGLITSPPYLNGTNYFRNTRLELWFLGYLKNKEDIRGYTAAALVAGINNVRAGKTVCSTKEIEEVVAKLSENAYDVRIPKMVADYFNGMEKIFSAVQWHSKKEARICIDIGDSIYGGVHIPTDLLLVGLLKDLGYTRLNSIKLRDRYSKKGNKLKQVLLVFEVR